MSKSINELFKSLVDGDTKNLPTKETELKNPDIPEYDETREIKDQFRINYRMPTAPRNGAGYALPRRSVINPKKESFLMDFTIDPNLVRAKTDPDNALPSLSRTAKFSYMPESVKPPHNQESLIKQSRRSELNWRNRFNPNVN